MSCFKFLPSFSRHVPLTIYQHNIKNILEDENEKNYQLELEAWKAEGKLYQEIYRNTRLYMVEPPEKKKLPCICNKCMKKKQLCIKLIHNQDWTDINFDYTFMNITCNNMN